MVLPGSIHFIGIGGYGMSGLAQVVHQLGWQVTGSDMKSSDRTRRLQAAGVTVFFGHDAGQVGDPGVVVYNTDVPPSNPELASARARGLKVWHRSELLAALLNERQGIAVTGTHGKTTTTSMISLVLERAGLDPTILIGGELDAIGGNAKLGRSPYLVAEACESDGSFLRYRPHLAVATNIEPEHLEHYGGDFSRVVAAFEDFIGQVREGGLAVLCSDDPNLGSIADRTPVPVIRYGLQAGAEITATDILQRDGGSRFKVWHGGQFLGEMSLAVPGFHNVLNALAVVTVSMHLGVNFQMIAEILATFGGARRRFQKIADVSGIVVVDDYAHHPTEVNATIRAAKESTGRRVVAVFQPQRYVRTYNLMKEFSKAFSYADVIILTDIYSPPGEEPIPGVSSEVLAGLIEQHEGRGVILLHTKDEIVRYLLDHAVPGDLILTMGAGDIWTVARDLGERLASAGAAC